MNKQWDSKRPLSFGMILNQGVFKKESLYLLLGSKKQFFILSFMHPLNKDLLSTDISRVNTGAAC